MGLNDNINKISRDLTETTKRQLTAAEKKQEEKETKENIKEIFTQKTTEAIENINNLQDLETITTNFIKNKNYNVNIIVNDFQDLYNKKLSKKYIDYISINYLQWILAIRKEKFYILKQQEKQQKEAQKQAQQLQEFEQKEAQAQKIAAAQKWQIFYKIIKTIILILIIPIVFIGSILLECCKTSSKRKR